MRKDVAMNAKQTAVIALTILLLSATGAAAQIPPPTISAPVPHSNPSSSLTVPAPGEVPVSPTTPGTSLGSQSTTGFWYGRSSCSVFRRGPCFPHYLPPIGQDLRLTIVSTDNNDPEKPSGDDTDAHDHALDSIREMFAALRECWLPPPKGEARHGMEYTIRFAFKRDGEIIAAPRMTYASHDAPADVRDIYRDAIDAALKRCTPLHFSQGMGGAVAGRPIAIRFVDNRTIDNGK
jgi:hypothetical protein